MRMRIFFSPSASCSTKDSESCITVSAHVPAVPAR